MNEYTDHEAAHRECDGSSGDCERMTAERGALRADNERLRELVRAQVQAGCSCPDCRVWMDRARDALGFYANQDNWRNAGSPSGFDNDGVPAEWDEVPQSSACAENQGATARAALGEITNGISHAS